MSVDEFEMMDASYVLGSLSTADRERFERHLETCDACMVRVSQLWNLRGLLSLAPASAFDPAEPDQQHRAEPVPNVPPAGAGDGFGDSAVPLPDTLLPRLLSATRRTQRLRRARVGSSVAAFAACLLLFGAVALTRGGSDPQRAPDRAVAMANVGNVPITAHAEIVTHDTWAQVNLWCTYRASAGYVAGNYRAVARDRSGHTVQVGSWPALPGQTAVIRTPTTIHTADLAGIDILNADGTTISRLSL